MVHKLICMGMFYSVFLTCWINDLLSFTYTTTAAMAAVAGVIVYGLGEERIRDFAAVVIFCVIAYNLRSAIFLMVLPICGILWLDKVSVKKQVKKQCILVGVLVIGMFVMLFEARARYLYTFIPFFVMMSVKGYCEWYQWNKKRRNDLENKRKRQLL